VLSVAQIGTQLRVLCEGAADTPALQRALAVLIRRPASRRWRRTWKMCSWPPPVAMTEPAA
jgi:hypothetical protein